MRRDHARTVSHLQRMRGINPLCMMLVFLQGRFPSSLRDCKITASGFIGFFFFFFAMLKIWNDLAS